MSGLKESCNLYFGSCDIYEIFSIKKDATDAEVKKAYRKLSLLVHPDRVLDDKKEEATEKFKVLGKLHYILSDSERRKVYDDTGCLDEFNSTDLQESDWYDYWKLIFQPITKKELDDYEIKYKESEAELEDLKEAYEKGQGDMDVILDRVPYSSPNDEPRFRETLQKLIDNGEMINYEAFSNENPSKAKKRREMYEREAKRAKKANDLRKKKGKSKMNEKEENVDIDAFKAIMARKKERETAADNFLKNLEEKYCVKGKKKA